MTDFTRPMRLAEQISGHAASDLEQHLAEQIVLISLDPEPAGAYETAKRLATTLARVPGRLLVAPGLLTDGQRDDLTGAAAAIRASALAPSGSAATVRVHVGATAPRGSIRVLPDGYGAQIASDDSVELRQHRPGNALGVVLAAALAATEVFKITAAIPASRATRQAFASFCPVTLGTDLTVAPDLPVTLVADIGLVGVGAVGSASASILGELPLSGHALIVDRERFAPENLATYSLGDENDARSQPWKTHLGAAAMPQFENTCRTELIERIPGEIDTGFVRWPPIVLSGLDSIPARHATQRLWPDLLIDAATGDTMVGIHVAEPDQPCLMCFLPPRLDGPSAAERVAAATGLPVARATRGDNELTEQDLEDLTIAQRALLLPHLGKPVCGLADAFGLSELDADGYLPAIPFASQQAACLGVGRLLAHLLGVPRADNFVQYDVFRGPGNATVDRHAAPDECYCSERHTTIAQVRELRRGSFKQAARHPAV